MYLESHVLERVWLINCEGDQHDMRIEIREHVKSLDMGNGVRSSQNLNSRLDDYRVFNLATGEVGSATLVIQQKLNTHAVSHSAN